MSRRESGSHHCTRTCQCYLDHLWMYARHNRQRDAVENIYFFAQDSGEIAKSFQVLLTD